MALEGIVVHVNDVGGGEFLKCGHRIIRGKSSAHFRCFAAGDRWSPNEVGSWREEIFKEYVWGWGFCAR